MADLVKPELPEFYSPGRVFLSAFAASAAIAAHKAQLQQNLQELDMRNKQMQVKQDLDQKNYELDVQKLAYTHQYQMDEIKVREDEQKRLFQQQAFDKGVTDIQRTGATSMTGEVNSLTETPDSQDWRNKAYDILLKHPEASLTPEYNLLKKRVERSASNPAIKTQQSLLDQAIKDAGIDPKSAYKALNHPDQFTQPIPGDDSQIGIYVGEKPRSGSLQPIDASVTPSDQAFAKKTEHVKGMSGSTQVPAIQVNPTKLYVPVKKSRWEALQKTFQSVAGTQDGTARNIVQPGPPEAPPQPKYKAGDNVTLKNGQSVTIKAVNPDGTYVY